MPKQILFIVTLFTILTFDCVTYGQSKYDSYEKKWEIINSDTVSKDKKLLYLDSYIEKAHNEKNSIEEYRGLKKKSRLLPFNQAVMLLHKMTPLVQNLKNDSITGDFLNRSTTLYYKNRHFNEALDYAIQAEKFNEKTNNLYNLNGARVDIGNIYYHTQRYQKAKEYFLLAKDYYKSSDNYSHIQGYIGSLYNLGKCYWKLEDNNALNKTIKEIEQILFKLKPKDKIVETAYLNYIKAGNAFLNKDYKAAQTYFESALPEILRNEDVTNEYVIYLYLGKIKWEQNKKQEAIVYFSKINSLFQESKFLNYELRVAYNYLRTYYKENAQTALQLQATESLITLNQQFEKEQRYLTDVLHHQLETQELQAEKIALQKQLKKNNKHSFGLWVVIFAAAVLVLIAFFVWKFRNKNKSLVVSVSTAIPAQDSIENSLATDENKIDNTDFQLIGILQNDSNPKHETHQIVSEHKKEDTFVKLTSTEKRLMQEFKVFEAKKEFKKNSYA